MTIYLIVSDNKYKPHNFWNGFSLQHPNVRNFGEDNPKIFLTRKEVEAEFNSIPRGIPAKIIEFESIKER
jgi:hypothetical protein